MALEVVPWEKQLPPVLGRVRHVDRIVGVRVQASDKDGAVREQERSRMVDSVDRGVAQSNAGEGVVGWVVVRRGPWTFAAFPLVRRVGSKRGGRVG